MAEALAAVGAAASIVDLVGKTVKIVARIYEFQSSTSTIPKAFNDLWQELPALELTFKTIKDAGENDRLGEEQTKVLDPLLKSCFEQIRLLQDTISGLLTADDDSRYSRLRKGAKSLQKEKAIEKAVKTLRNYNQTLSYHFMIASSTSALIEAQEKKFVDIRSWLSAPDSNTNYSEALKSRHDDTGRWFVESETFSRWKESPGSLWLHGIPGCGKTILASTILENVLEDARDDPSKVVAFFYFDFNDPRKQRSKLLLHSLVSQISFQTVRPWLELSQLFTACRCGDRQPTDNELLLVLRPMVESIPHVYIVLDALDECEDRQQLMDLFATVSSWQAPGLHFLATSRREHEIELCLRDFIDTTDIIGLQSHVVDPDIRSYVRQRLDKDHALRKWQRDVTVRQEIETAIMRGAQGMFRWAACQLDSLSRCRNRIMLRKALVSLPPTLDETYDRILCKIDEDDADYAYRILYWLAFSKRPLLIEEVAETIAISSDRDPAFVREEVLEDPQDALIMCSSLISIVSDETPPSNGPSGQMPGAIRVVLAHYSVKEYLISERIHQGGAKRFGMSAQIGHNLIAESCLHYLLQVEEPQINDIDWLDRNALAGYSAFTWCHHAQANGDAMADHLHDLIYTLFTSKKAFSHWLMIEKPDEVGQTPDAVSVCLSRQLSDLPTPMYYACMLGLYRVAEQLIDNEGADVNVKGGRFGSPMQAAAINCQEATVKVLICRGADVNLQGGRHGNALSAACVGGCLSIVKLLLDGGADVNATGGRYQTALQAAAIEGQADIIKLLFERGADPNIQGGRYGNALQAASAGGWEAVAKLLLDGGADVNAIGGRYGSALQAASVDGHEKIVKILLQRGANANLKGRYGKSAKDSWPLQAAAHCGHVDVVKMLLDGGADADVCVEEYTGPVQEALAAKRTAVVTVLEAAPL